MLAEELLDDCKGPSLFAAGKSLSSSSSELQSGQDFHDASLADEAVAEESGEPAVGPVASRALLGRVLVKVFPGHGTFRGVVVGVGDCVTVRFDDGNVEDLSFAQAQRLVLLPS